MRKLRKKDPGKYAVLQYMRQGADKRRLSASDRRMPGHNSGRFSNLALGLTLFADRQHTRSDCCAGHFGADTIFYAMEVA